MKALEAFLKIRYKEVCDQLARLSNLAQTSETQEWVSALESEKQRIEDQYAAEFDGTRPPPPPPPPPPWWY
jgi:hypothetical protein